MRCKLCREEQSLFETVISSKTIVAMLQTQSGNSAVKIPNFVTACGLFNIVMRIIEKIIRKSSFVFEKSMMNPFVRRMARKADAFRDGRFVENFGRYCVRGDERC